MASTDEHWDPVFEVPPGFVDGLFRLDDRVAAVTGGGSGLGAAMAKGLAQAGAAVAIVDVADEGAAHTVATIEEQGGVAVAMQLRRDRQGRGRRARRARRRRASGASMS